MSTGTAEVRCIVKNSTTIGAGACVEQQREGCYCPFGRDAVLQIQFTLSMSTLTETRADGAVLDIERARLARERASIIVLRARADGFEHQKRDHQFAGPALRVVNERRARHALLMDAAERVTSPAPKPVTEVTTAPPAQEEVMAEDKRLCSKIGCKAVLASINKSGRCADHWYVGKKEQNSLVGDVPAVVARAVAAAESAVAEIKARPVTLPPQIAGRSEFDQVRQVRQLFRALSVPARQYVIEDLQRDIFLVNTDDVS